MMIDEIQAPTPQIAKDNQTRLFMQFILIYLLILLSGWLNHLSQPVIREVEAESAALHNMPHEIDNQP